MGLFDHFPYTNVHELNLDWIVSMMKALEAEWEAFTAGNSLQFADPMLHDVTKTYAKNTIVLDDTGNAYVSLQAVPIGVGLQNGDYWLMVFDYEAFIEKVNKNFTVRYYRGSYRATAAMAIGDWLTVDDVLYKATAAIAVDDILEDGVNITHFTLEDFIKAFMQSANQLIQQYKNDIDASELLYRQQLADDIANTTASLQAQLDAAISGATVDSEVINARVGWDSETYPTLGDAIRGQITDIHNVLDNVFVDITDTAIDTEWNTGGTTYQSTLSTTTYGNAAAIHQNVSYGDMFIITATCTSGGRAFYVLDASDKVIRWYNEASLSLSDYIIQIYEPDAAKVIIQTSNKNSNWRVIKSSICMDDLMRIMADFTDHEYTEMGVGSRWFTGTQFDQPLTETTNASCKSAVIDVSPMDTFRISCTGGSGGRAWYVLDSSDNVITMSNSGATLTDATVVMPIGAATFVVQTNNSSNFKIEKIYDYDTLSSFVKYFSEFFLGSYITGGTSGDYYTGKLYKEVTLTSYGPAIANYINVLPYERYEISGSSGSSGAACYILDEFYRVIFHTEFSTTINNRTVVIPSNGRYMIAQSTQKSTYKCFKLPYYEFNESILKADDEAADQFNRESFTSATKYLNALLSHYETERINIALIGDSWTQGTPDNIDSGKYESYVKWLSMKLWDKYGYGGLGWLDFARDGGTGKMFGCVDLYDHWTYAFSGTVTGVDGSGSDADAAASLGICCAHTEFESGATLHLTFDAGYLDMFTIKYYKDAHFTVSINNGAAVEITANSTDGWQSTTLGTTGTDTTDVLITALDDSIIFGMNCNYGSYGIKCHKIGNRSLKLKRYLMMDDTQFKSALSQLNICWCSLLFAINDLGSSGDDYSGITGDYVSFIDWIQSANSRADINILGCANISDSGYANLPVLEKYLCKFAASRSYGWASSRNCVGSDKNELSYTGLFSDDIHLNKYGSRLFGEYIADKLF